MFELTQVLIIVLLGVLFVNTLNNIMNASRELKALKEENAKAISKDKCPPHSWTHEATDESESSPLVCSKCNYKLKEESDE